MKKQYSKLIMMITLFILLFLTISNVGAAPAAVPVVTLTTAQSEYRTSQDVLVNVTYLNPTKHSIRILKWFTPKDGVEESIFSVKMNGKSVNYIGAIYKRPAATGNDYITLKAGQSLGYVVNLGEFYNLSRTGEYEIYYSVSSYNLYNEKNTSINPLEFLKSETISFKVEGRPTKKPTPPPPPGPGETSFTACTVTQQDILVNARNQAKTYASESENYLFGINSGTLRYVEWFGLFATTRFSTVKTHFTALSDAWDNAGINFNCRCKQNYYAYVYPNEPYNIYLCKVFWLAPLVGTDSQGGTLIHEMSHFYVVASTDDYGYGQTFARNLADTNPDQAIMNADNHEYFAENNPFLQ